MKTDIHPDYVETTVTCSCGRSFQTRSVRESLNVELCSECHPFFTGKQRLVDTGGRVERFRKRVDAKDPEAEKRAAEKRAAEKAQAQEQAKKAKVSMPKPAKRAAKKDEEEAAAPAEPEAETPPAETAEAPVAEAAPEEAATEAGADAEA